MVQYKMHACQRLVTDVASTVASTGGDCECKWKCPGPSPHVQGRGELVLLELIVDAVLQRSAAAGT